MGDPPYVTSKPVRQDLRGSPWSAGQANSAERWLWKTVFRRLSTCLSTGILNIIVYHIICGKSTPIVENFMNSTKFPRGNLRKLWRAKTDEKRAFSTGGAAWKVARRSLCGIAFRQPTAKRGHRSRLPRCRNAVLLRNAGAAGGIVFVKNVKNRQKIRAACPKQLWRTCGKRKKAENFAKKFAGGLDK